MVKSTNWRRCNKTPSEKNKNKKIKEIIKEIRNKTETSTTQINYFLEDVPHYTGCFADDELINFSIQSFPSYLICNLDHSSGVGSHWIALRFDRKVVEIFDPLGFNTKLWPKLPVFLLNFLHNLSHHKQIIMSGQVQPSNSLLCGFYCIFYVLNRQNISLNQLMKLFSKRLYKNDSVLAYNFKKSTVNK